MKYRFRVSNKTRSQLPVPFDPASHRRCFRLKGRNAPRHSVKGNSEPITFSALFELAALPEYHKQKKSKKRWATWRKRIALATSTAFGAIRHALVSLCRRIRVIAKAVILRLHPTPKQKSIHALPVFAGFLCATLLVSVLCGGGILMGLFGQYHRSYTGIVIPNVVGQQAEDIQSEQFPHLNWVIEYETNPEVAEGQIISQSPPAGVTRRLYGRDSFCTVYLCVSQATEPYTLENLIGMSQRDALLTLRNHQISATVTELYSDTVPKGQVLQTIPATGTRLANGAEVTLRVSAGKKETIVSVPNLFGMTETEANSLLASIGLAIGTVNYQSSSRAAGTIITQDLAPYTSVKNDTELSYTVSVGDRYALPRVPDLYGMNLSTAEQLLKQQGLVIGQIHTISNAAPKGTVILQSPSPGAPITSSTVSVEIYVSS